ncbi:hypothetical protein DVH05_027787 [Phytophthora capsici]|nr:hypothetical protein DVH05_027787 [Phytophthora capsici]
MISKAQYKRIKAEESSAKFLSVIARNLSNFYVFHYEFETFPTIDDVFRALDRTDWEFRLKDGNPLTNVDLPQFFTEDEWNELKELNQRLHNGKLFTTSTGKPAIILPHGLFNEEKVAAFKEIAVKGNLVSHPSELEVYDESE